jgi:hypothetical protein
MVALSRQMLDTGCWIFKNALTVKSRNIEYLSEAQALYALRAGGQKPVSRIIQRFNQ